MEELRAALQTGSNDDRLLLQDPADNPICRVYYEPGIPCVAISWLSYATSTQLRFVGQTVLALIDKNRSNRVLADLTHLPALSQTDQEWVLDDLVPRLIAAGLEVIGYINPASYFARISIEGLMRALPGVVVVRNFTDAADAREWLKSIPDKGAAHSA